MLRILNCFGFKSENEKKITTDESYNIDDIIEEENSKINYSSILNQYKKFHIQNLDKKKETNMYQHKPYFGDDIYFYKDTGIGEFNERIYHSNNFIGAFINAYNYHGDIVLNPDDIWLMISLYFSQYIENHSETLRKMFINNETIKDIIIIENAGTIEQANDMEKNWDYFFTEIINVIGKNTHNNVIDELVCDFSTSGKVQKLISTAIIMNSFKKYFKYGRMILSCGISNVYFDGIRNDWERLIIKADNLRKYDVDGKLIFYLDKIEIILREFLNTFDNKPNVDFWNTIMTTKEYQIGSGWDIQTFIKGWIMHFYGIYDEIDLDNVPSYVIDIPINLYNEYTQQTKKLNIKANWVSISKLNEFTYKPDIGVWIS